MVREPTFVGIVQRPDDGPVMRWPCRSTRSRCSPRTVDVPDELASALDAVPDARAAFDRLSFSHRREHAQWVAAAKRADTRVRRAASTVQRLLESPD